MKHFITFYTLIIAPFINQQSSDGGALVWIVLSQNCPQLSLIFKWNLFTGLTFLRVAGDSFIFNVHEK